MTSDSSSSAYRQRLVELYDEFTALLALKQYLTAEEYEKVKLARVALRVNPRTLARKAEADLRKRINAMRAQLGVKANRASLIALLRNLEAGGEKTIVYVAKPALDEIADYRRILEDFDRLPLHGRVGLSIRLANLDRQGEMHLFVLEHKIYEDMAILFNLCQDRYLRAKANRHWKPHDALLRATVVSTFAFVEAYLNGIADDYLLERGSAVDSGTREILTEWDEGRVRPKYLSLERKALRYPAVYCGASRPPVRVDNCPELAILLDMAKTRDALVHAGVHKRGRATSKEDVFFELTFEEVEVLVDAALGFVKRVEREIGRDSVVIDWLAERGADGRFLHDTE